MTSFKLNLSHYSLSLLFISVAFFVLSCQLLSDRFGPAQSLLCSHSLTLSSLPASISFNLTNNSLLFCSVVCFITSVVIMFSLSYIGLSYLYFEFLTLTVLFVTSIIMVILLNDILTVIVGWDGLGVISFFLIIFYQSPNNIFSGWFTLLMNRIGDSLLILSVVYLWYSDVFSGYFYLQFPFGNIWIPTTLLAGLITNSAIFPFSPWLPVAISAPTPISSLVHSSTLVTAGLYLMMRFETYLFFMSSISSAFSSLCLFTSFYAGVCSLVEPDLKNLVALSTLSHLGFIGLSISMGAIDLAFFHLLVHALFKSLLFMGVGDWISVGQHYQDARKLSSGVNLTPVSGLVVLSSVLSLLGFPYASGFYSNDYVLEFSGYSSLGLFLIAILYLNVSLTFIYTLRVVRYLLVENSTHSPFYITMSFSYSHFLSLSILSFISFVLPSAFWGSHFYYFICAPSAVHLLPLLILFLTVVSFYLSNFQLALTCLFPQRSHLIISSMFSTMVFMSTLYSSFISQLWINIENFSTNSIENGAFGVISSLYPSSLPLIWGGVALSYLSKLVSVSLFISLVCCIIAYV